MSRVYNFSAGPAVLPEEVLQEAAAEMMDYRGCGMSVMEMSHRSKVYDNIIKEAEQDLRDLMHIPDNYKVLFLQGGASQQFAAVPMNLMKNKKAGYIITGQWAKKAYQEAKMYGEAVELASSADKTFSYIPDCSDLAITDDMDYVYICENNTIYGTEYKEDLDSPVPLIADMSSDILSRPVDVSKYAMIYGGAQKNLAPAGVSFVIIRDDMLEKVVRPLPTMVNVNTHVDNNSMFNTPPVFPIYVLSQTLRWLKAEGGVEAIHERNERKAAMLYAEIDRNPLFKGTAAVEDRSSMNICFVMSEGNEELASEFMTFAKERGMVGIKGHRLVGGFRASCYNACPVESVEALVACMQEFEQMHK